jgi:tetratricopeptide (TPR) repeat protein
MSQRIEERTERHISRSTRVVILSLAFLTASFLGYLSIRAALAAHYLELNTVDGFEKATQLEPLNAWNWYSLGRYWQFNMENPDLGRAVSAYRKALELNPQSAEIWLDLASAYESETDINAARKAYLEARRVYPVSADVSWSYGNFLLRQNEKMEGFAEIHRAVEADPTRGLGAFLLCRHIEPDLDVILDQVLPPNAAVYQAVIWELTDEKKSDQVLKVWSKFLALQPKLTTREVFFFVDGLLGNGRTVEAQTVWRQAITLIGLPKMEEPPGSLIWDGGFETDVTGGGLAWHIQAPPKILISYDRKVKHSGARALRIDFSFRGNSYLAGLCQRVVVEPNVTYELSAWLRTRETAEGRSIFLKLAEAGTPWKQYATTPELSGSNEWTRVSTQWTSPDNSRLAEVCLQRSPGLQSSQLPTTTWVDDVSLVKIE